LQIVNNGKAVDALQDDSVNVVENRAARPDSRQEPVMSPTTRRPRRPLICVSIIASLAVTACSSTDHRASAPAATSGSTPPSTSSSATPASTTSGPTIDPTETDGTTQARLHVVLTDLHGPNTDLFVNGVVAVNGGQAQVNVPVGYVTAYLYVPPGTSQVALAPTGKGLAQSLIEPLDVPMIAGHRYLVAFMGQIADKSLEPVVIDETKAAADIGATPSDSVTITLNDLAGSTGLDYEWAGKLVNADIPVGGFAAGITPAGGGHITVTAKGVTDTKLIDEENYVVPGDTVFGLFGPDSTDKFALGVVGAAPTSELSVIDYLHAFDPEKLVGPSGDTPSFHTVLDAIETAGLTEMYSAATPLLFLPPTDQAFGAMPAAERDALLADPAALATLLRAHTIEAYVPRGSLATTPGGTFDRTFTNLMGDTIKIGNDFSVNGAGSGYSSTWLANGTQIHPVGTVIFPPA
jgi:uncharacterized surface protein with fasciclin (FAS1) repeats